MLEVRYPKLAREFNEDKLHILQETVRDRLPVFEPLIEQRLQIVPYTPKPLSAQSRSLLRFSSRDHTTSLLVRSDALVLETTAYAGWNQSFRPLVAEAINALLQANRPDGVKRIGLRYIDEIRIPGVGDKSGTWKGYINASLLTAASTELIPSDMRLQQWQGIVQYSTVDPTITLAVRYGPQDGYAVNPEGATRRRNPPSPGYFFLLDSDSSWCDEDEIPEYDAKWILECCDRLHSQVSEFFTTAVTDKLRNEVFNLAEETEKEDKT